MEIKNKSEKLNKEYEEKGLSKILIDEDIFLMHLIFKNQEEQEKSKGPKKTAIEDKNARKEILAVHAKNKILNKEITLENLAKRTPGFSGADTARTGR